MAEYKIGQILVFKKDVKVEKALSNEIVVIPKESKAIIGADNLAHHLSNDMMQPLGDAEVSGYDAAGLAKYLIMSLKSHFPIDEMLENYDIEEKELMDEIKYALNDIGM